MVAGLVLVGSGLVYATAGAGSAAVEPGLGYDPADLGSLSSISRIVGAQDAWAAGFTGAGVDVALIDTGVAPVPGLDARGKVVTGPDLSFDSQAGWPPGADANGHGTFMAGVIAGRDAGAGRAAAGCGGCLNSSGYSDTTRFVGIAPDARIVNVKVGAADGAVDVTQVIAGIDWVVQHAHDPGLNIRVISLSYGTDSAQPYGKDPLAQAAEQAWRHGIVVVAASGNDGKTYRRVADPGYDPYLIAVGADDPRGTLSTADDVVPGFAQHGNARRPIDLIAPAVHVIGLRVPGSYVDTLPDNTGQVGTRFQRGTGTSQATAIVAGVAALVLQRYPSAGPDQVKALLDATATAPRNPEADGQRVHWGHGVVNAAAAITAPLPRPAAAVQVLKASTGKGTLDAARNGVYVADHGVDLTGQQDIFAHPFNAKAIASLQARAAAWTGGIWNGTRWTGDTWTAPGPVTADSPTPPAWIPATWTGPDWAAQPWTGSRWGDMTWDGSRWGGSRWGSSQWTGAGWDGSRWSTYASG